MGSATKRLPHNLGHAALKPLIYNTVPVPWVDVAVDWSIAPGHRQLKRADARKVRCLPLAHSNRTGGQFTI